MNYDTDHVLLMAALAGRSKGGAVTPEEIQQAVDNYLKENPVSPGKLSVNDHIISIQGVGDENITF